MKKTFCDICEQPSSGDCAVVHIPCLVTDKKLYPLLRASVTIAFSHYGSPSGEFQNGDPIDLCPACRDAALALAREALRNHNYSGPVTVAGQE